MDEFKLKIQGFEGIVRELVKYSTIDTYDFIDIGDVELVRVLDIDIELISTFQINIGCTYFYRIFHIFLIEFSTILKIFYDTLIKY